MVEYCLNVEQVAQPSPQINKGGDCFACSMTAALSTLFPERNLTLNDIFETFKTEDSSGNPTIDSTFSGMEHAFKKIRYPKKYSKALKIEFLYDIVMPNWTHQYDPIKWAHEWWQFEPITEWTYRLEGWLRSGWIGLQSIKFDGSGPFPKIDDNGTIWMTPADHFVVVDGIKYGWEDEDDGGRSYNHYVHVVCSVKGKYWIDVRRFMRNHGAAAWWLVRKEVV